MKKLFILFLLVSAFSVAKAQSYYSVSGLNYSPSSITPLANATFGLVNNAANGDRGLPRYTMYLNLPSGVEGHILYAGIRIEGEANGQNFFLQDSNNNLSGSFNIAGHQPLFIEWSIEYDNGSWQTLSGYLNYSTGSFEVYQP